jgi:hypothetical protein
VNEVEGHSSPTESSELQDGSLALFASMLGTDQAPQDREDAASALWQQSFESTEKLDLIGKIPGK